MKKSRVLIARALLAGCATYLALAPSSAGSSGPATVVQGSRASISDPVYVCPNDPDVRSSQPGVRPCCGMALVAAIPDPVEYLVDVTAGPQPLRLGEPATLRFTIRDPWKGRPVARLVVMHENLVHVFVVPGDVELFAHIHPASC